MAHPGPQRDAWDLDETTEFLVVAAILLDLKAARLLPGDSEEDEEDLALLEARDLLFARLLQYRAFKDASDFFAERLYAAPPRVPARVGMDAELSALLPDVDIPGSHDDFCRCRRPGDDAARRTAGERHHIHAPGDQRPGPGGGDRARLRRHEQMTFRALVSDCPDVPTSWPGSWRSWSSSGNRSLLSSRPAPWRICWCAGPGPTTTRWT